MFLSNANKSKTYYLYFLNPVTNKVTSRSCKTKLKSEALRVMKEFKIGNSPRSKIDISSLKLSTVRDKLLSHYQSNNSKNTFLSYRNSFDNLSRIIGDMFISSIGKSDLEEFKLRRSKEVNLISTNIDIRNIKAMFNKLIEFELLEFSKIKTIKQFKIEKKKMLAIDPHDIEKILNSEIGIQLKQIVRFTFLTASRISEVLNMRIKDIDFDREEINIFQQKTNSYKVIPLSSGLVELLSEITNENNYRNVFTMTDNENYLFFNKLKNNRCFKLRADTISKQFKNVLRKLKLNNDFKFHSLRHTSITELLRNNTPIHIVKEIAGHKSISTTMIYSHVKSSDLKKAVNALNF